MTSTKEGSEEKRQMAAAKPEAKRDHLLLMQVTVTAFSGLLVETAKPKIHNGTVSSKTAPTPR